MSSKVINVLVAAPSAQDRRDYARWTEEEGLQADEARSAAELLEKVATGNVAVVVMESEIAALGPVEFVAGLCSKLPEVYVVLVLEKGQESMAASALKSGAKDCLMKPVSRHDLVTALARVLEQRRINLDRDRLEQESNENRTRAAVLRRAVASMTKLESQDVLEEFLGLAMDETGSQGGAVWLADPSVPGLFNVAAFRGVVSWEDRSPFYRGERALPPGLFKGETCVGLQVGGKLDLDTLYAPIKDSVGLKGLIKLTGKLGKPGYTELDRLVLRDIAEAASVGLKNARLVETLKRKMLQDSDVPAYNMQYFMDYTSKEVYKARRYGRTFSMAAMKVDNYQVLEGSMNPQDLYNLMREFAAEVGMVIRDSDVLTRVDDETYFLLLPETDYLGSMMCMERILRRLKNKGMLAPLQGRPPVSLSMGSAAFPRDGDEYEALVLKCKLRMEEAKKSLFRRLHLEELDFWDAARILLSRESGEKIKDMSDADRDAMWSWLFDRDGPDFGLVQEEAALELGRNKELEGILFLGVEKLNDELPFMERYAELEGTRMKMFVLGKRAVSQWKFPLITPVAVPVAEDDERFCNFILMFSEAGAYMYMRERGERGRVFHSSDSTLVSRMVAKLQDHYKLQRQF